MGFKKISVSLGLLILFVMPMVLALDTPIQVKTQPNYAVTIRALDFWNRNFRKWGVYRPDCRCKWNS